MGSKNDGSQAIDGSHPAAGGSSEIVVEQRQNRKFDPEAEISVSGSNFRFL